MVRCMSERLRGEEAGARSGEAEADFGFRRVPRLVKSRLVREVFDRVATRYDLMNDLMSAGIHRLWKDAMVDWLAPRPTQYLLDVAGGTGDVAFRVHTRTHGRARITVCDVNADMTRVGRDRALDRGIVARLPQLPHTRLQIAKPLERLLACHDPLRPASCQRCAAGR